MAYPIFSQIVTYKSFLIYTREFFSYVSKAPLVNLYNLAVSVHIQEKQKSHICLTSGKKKVPKERDTTKHTMVQGRPASSSHYSEDKELQGT